jgi:hypothetical protein
MEVHIHDNAEVEGSSRLKGLPLWLLTCRAFLNEGLQELDLISTITVGSGDPKTTFEWGYTELIYPVVKGSMTVLLDSLYTNEHRGARWRLKDASIRVLNWILDNTVSDVTLGDHTIPRSKPHTLRLRTAFLNVCFPCQIWYRPHRPAESSIEWGLDLSPLRAYDLDLDVFEFEVADVTTTIDVDGHDHYLNCWHRAQGVFERDLRRFGKWLLRDGNGTSTVTTSFTSPSTVLFRVTKQARQGEMHVPTS